MKKKNKTAEVSNKVEDKGRRWVYYPIILIFEIVLAWSFICDNTSELAGPGPVVDLEDAGKTNYQRCMEWCLYSGPQNRLETCYLECKEMRIVEEEHPAAEMLREWDDVMVFIECVEIYHPRFDKWYFPEHDFEVKTEVHEAVFVNGNLTRGDLIYKKMTAENGWMELTYRGGNYGKYELKNTHADTVFAAYTDRCPEEWY